MKIFWSWQSDTPGKVGRFLVRDALQEAIGQLKEAPEIEEPTAKDNREALHLDQDIKGVEGSPDLARTIFDKVGAAEVFVADVTLVGQVASTDGDGKPVFGKKLINSNVAIELGYALRALTDKRVLMVFNEHYGRHEELPFDLRHKGGSITFDLPPGADRKRIDAEKKKLKDQFVNRLKPYLSKLVSFAAASFEEIPPTFNKAAYFQKGEVLAQVGDPGVDEVRFSYETDVLSYLRVIPAKRLDGPLPLALLTDAVRHAPLMSPQHGGLSTYNHYGAIIYEPGSNPPRGNASLNASTQLFQNGEIWCISAKLVVEERGQRPAWVKLPFLPSLNFERMYYDKLRAVVELACKRLGISIPWQVECGLVGTKGLHFVLPPEDVRGPIRKTEIAHRMILNDVNPASLDRFLFEFFSLVYDASGYARPTNLYGFPPHRPALAHTA